MPDRGFSRSGSARLWLAGLLGATFASALVAGTATVLDWRVNPSGLFQGPAGTHWAVVWETWVSWFLPALFVATLLSMPVLVWRRRARRVP